MAFGQGEQHTIPEQWTMDQGLWFLTNQLYRPTNKSVTPAFRFGFAVDGGRCAGENTFPNRRRIPKECYCGQAFAINEGRMLDAGDTLTDRDAR